jgi:hypothetical protein
MLIMAGGHDGKPLDFEALERWTRVGFERGRGSARANDNRRVRLIRLLAEMIDQRLQFGASGG